MKWVDYELFVLNYFKSRYASSEIMHNVKKTGHLSKTKRQIDVLISQYVAGYLIEIVIECKNWKKTLDVTDIEQFVSKLNDLKIAKGAIVSRKGYTKAAREYANSVGNVQLHVLKIEDLEAFTGFWGNPYSGNCGAFLFPPNGWVLDSRIPSSLIGYTLCVMYPMEMNLLQSIEEKECIFFYIPFTSEKQETPENMAKNLEGIIKEQEKGIKKYDSTATFNYQDVKLKKGQTKMRVTNYNDYVEVASFFVTDYCILFVFGVCKSQSKKRLIEHVNFVVDEMIIVVLANVDLTNSHEAWNSFLSSYLQTDKINVAIFR